MPDHVTVRIATYHDAGELARLNALFNDVHDPPELVARRLQDSRTIETPLLAEKDGKAVGFASLLLIHSPFYEAPYAEITELFVEAGVRRQGVGRALMEKAEQLAHQRGTLEIRLVTSAENQTAQAFYHSLGYKESREKVFEKITSSE